MWGSVRTTGCLVAVATLIAVTGAMTGVSGARTQQPEGVLRCGLTGEMTFKPGIPSASKDPHPKKIKAKLKADIVDCDGSGVLNAKAPITGGTLQITASLAEDAWCGDLPSPPDFTSYPSRVKTRWWTTTDKGKHPTVANNSTVLYDYTDISRGWELYSDTIEDNKPFAGQTITMSLVFDNLGDVGSCLLGGPDLISVKFSAAAGSTIRVDEG